MDTDTLRGKTENWSGASTNQGMPKTASKTPETKKKRGKPLPLRFQREHGPHPHLDFRFLASRTETIHFCHSTPPRIMVHTLLKQPQKISTRGKYLLHEQIVLWVLPVKYGISSPAEEDVCIQAGNGEGACPVPWWAGNSSGQEKAGFKPGHSKARVHTHNFYTREAQLARAHPALVPKWPLSSPPP